MKIKIIGFVFKLCIITVLFLVIFSPQTLGMKSLFGNVSPGDVWRALRNAGTAGPVMFVLWMGCATAVKLLGISAGIMRWRILLAGQGLRIPLHYLAYQWFMGRAIGLILPGTLGLDGYRLVESSRYTREPVKCAIVIAVEKLTGIIALSFLVFATFPLGFKYLQFNAPLLVLIMAVLLGIVVSSLLLLLNPRVIQVLAAIMPVPGVARGLINKLGQAATAYGGQKSSLFAALFFGVLVHLGTCSMYFFTFMAIRATNVSVADIFFVSPLLITASVLAFTISGLGVREVAFGLVLGSTAGHAQAILGGHLGLWAGELIPFMISIPLLLLGGRPERAVLKQERDAVNERIRTETSPMTVFLDAEEVRRFRREIFGLLCCGAVAGILAGAQIAVLESLWILKYMPGLQTWGMFPWGVSVYGIIFGCLGAAIAAGLVFLALLANRFPLWPVSAALVYAATFAVGALIIGLFRYQRDVLAGHALTCHDYLLLFAVCCGVALLLGTIGYVKAEYMRRRLHFSVPRFTAACLAGWLLLWGAAAVVAIWGAPGKPAVIFAPGTNSIGPNILLCAVDALRADYLRLYNPDADADTPNLELLANESILFYNTFSQASWTKPSFGTIFTGVYPTTHGANSKTASLSPNVETLAELLQQNGYFTKGFSNNPNMTRVFGMHRGFSDYVELKPERLFAAPESAVHLSMYGLLRKAFMTIEGRLRGGKLRVTDYYQPAESVTDTALSWLDSEDAMRNMPFYMYLHYMDTHDPFMDHNDPGVGYARARMENPDPARYKEKMRNAYISEIEYLDESLGVLIEGLKKRGIYDNTAIVFLADHGEEFFDHGGWWHGMTLYEEMLRVPLLIKMPRGMQGGTVNQSLVRLVDVAPTILQLAGAAPGKDMVGRLLCDNNGVAPDAGTAYSFAENDFEGNRQQSVRSLDAALIRADEDNPRGGQPVEFYDMQNDPRQQHNLADAPEAAEKVGEMQKVIRQYQQMILEDAPEPGENSGVIDPQLQQQLEALGYL